VIAATSCCGFSAIDEEDDTGTGLSATKAAATREGIIVCDTATVFCTGATTTAAAADTGASSSPNSSSSRAAFTLSAK
jgi:hypothetical protein